MKKKNDGEINELQKQLDELRGKYLRVLADYQNLEKRTFAEKEETRKFAVQIFLAKFLPVFDTLERVQTHLKDEGLNLALKELGAVLGNFGVEKIVALGKDFNPHEMECIEVVEGADNKVIAETLPGYKIHGKILRVAQVKVGKKLNN